TGARGPLTFVCIVLLYSFIDGPAELCRYTSDQLVQSREEELQGRRCIRSVIADDQVNRWRIASYGSTDHGPGQEIPRIGRQECHAACRRHQGHCHGEIVYFVIRLDAETESLQVIIDDDP